MGPLIEITDGADPRVAEYTRLRDVELRTKFEPPNGLFMAEGELVLARVLRAGLRLRSVLTQPGFLERLAPLLADDDDTPVYVADAPAIERITGFPVHRGSLASVNRPAPRSPEQLLAVSRRALLCEDVVNPTNLGAIFRSAAGLGWDAALLTPRCADPLYRRSVRTSMGEALALPYARLQHWPGDLAIVRERGFTVVALTPAPESVPLGTFDASSTARLALLVGTEGPGLSARALALADERVRIPMAAGVDSLNVAAATAIACWALGPRLTAPARCDGRSPGPGRAPAGPPRA